MLAASPIGVTTLNRLDATSTLPKESSLLRYIVYRAQAAAVIRDGRIYVAFVFQCTEIALTVPSF